MTGTLQVNQETVESEAVTIANAAKYFEPSMMTPIDTRTTLTANQSAKSAFETAQVSIGAFGELMDQEAANIRSLNVKFKEFDTMMGTLAESGLRAPNIVMK
jgi:type VII secretion effector (TIGR04197 family)